ncbi:tripartite tricarboxylate transporter TctB family protein [Massilia sp. Leaf139]|uniref:tripartite tricarboxylate transporter TctB family protein n=1 Tax=Massilia sp. Leaf139 TaxID=1736272 RepID=UPI0006F67E72|nr:tripartite tricarboxylate transporter TctB family protein [Massilia sp. Leaf139]KQQ97666.1 small permease of tripartite tricarboxylate transporter [Massilia sp. Leaf139]
MASFIRHPKDFWIGIIFLFFGMAAVVIGLDYPMGTGRRMGPAYFPTALGALLCLVGLVGVIRSFLREGEPVGKFHIREIVLILLAVILFGFLMRNAGLVPAALVLVLLSAYASPKFTWGPSLLLAAGLAAFAVIVFVKLLGLPMPILGPWFGQLGM